MSALYEPFWLEGKVSTVVTENDMAKSAYAMQHISCRPTASEFLSLAS